MIKSFIVDLSFGEYEQYFYDGKVLSKGWQWKHKRPVTFDINGEEVGVLVKSGRDFAHIYVYKNEEPLVKDDLPDLNLKKLKDRLKPLSEEEAHKGARGVLNHASQTNEAARCNMAW